MNKQCEECDHSGPWNEDGRCLFDISPYVDPEGPARYQKECFCHCVFPSAESAPFNPPTHRCNGVNDAQRHGTQNKCSVCGEYRNGWFDSNGMEVLTPKESVQSAGERIVGTVFDNTSASHETLKRTMVERIDAAIQAAIAKEQDRCAIKALEQRCERGTPWDAAIMAVVAAIRQGSTEPNEKQFPNVTKPC